MIQHSVESLNDNIAQLLLLFRLSQAYCSMHRPQKIAQLKISYDDKLKVLNEFCTRNLMFNRTILTIHSMQSRTE